MDEPEWSAAELLKGLQRQLSMCMCQVPHRHRDEAYSHWLWDALQLPFC